MARSFGKDVKNTFVRGVVSEFSGLNFPEDAAVDASNVIFNSTGIVSRRLGIDYETNHQMLTTTIAAGRSVIQEYIWENVDGNGSLSFLVLQLGTILYFYLITDTGSLSANRRPFTVSLTNYTKTAGSGDFPCQFTQGGGHLFVAHPKCDPFRVKYTATASGAGSLEVTLIGIKIRDLQGVDDGMNTSFRPVKNKKTDQMNASHRYNLWNQGWYGTIKVQDVDGRLQALEAWRSKREDFPSNSDMWWVYRNANNKFDHNFIDRSTRGTEAPKGHFILNAFKQDRNALVSLEKSLPITDSTSERPACIAFYSGRLFYAGVAAPQYHDKIYYSQIIIDGKGYEKCYQHQDPTDEDTASLLPTDGGVITLSDVGKIIKLIPIQGFLLIFATNGIWSIAGGAGDFKATDYSIQKISDIQTTSASSFVTPKTGFPIWWNADGIYTVEVATNELTSQKNLEVKSLSDSTIRSTFRDIPALAKKYAKGAFNPLENIIQWVYWDESPSTLVDYYHYNKVLILDLDTNAFYFWEVPYSVDTPYVTGVIATRGSGVELEEVVIVDDAGAEIEDASEDPVTVFAETIVPLSSSFRYTTAKFISGSTWDVTFSQFRQSEFLDWLTDTNENGVDYESFFETGYVIRGDAQRTFQNNVVFVYSSAVENSSCYLQGIWDYSIDDESGKETSAHQVYIDRSFVGVQRRKIRMRGRGFALQLRFFSETGKDFNIVGWSAFQSANNIP